MQYPQRERNHLQILASRCRANVPRPRADIVDNGPLQPWYQKVGALIGDLVLDTGQTVEDDGAGSAFDVVERCLEERGADGQGDDKAED